MKVWVCSSLSMKVTCRSWPGAGGVRSPWWWWGVVVKGRICRRGDPEEWLWEGILIRGSDEHVMGGVI